jgi:hypothetical protein
LLAGVPAYRHVRRKIVSFERATAGSTYQSTDRRLPTVVAIADATMLRHRVRLRDARLALEKPDPTRSRHHANRSSVSFTAAPDVP